MAPKRPVWIPVVTGLIRKGGLVLVGQRPTGHSLAGQWEFPGGKIEKGETPEEALQRELNEELGIDAEVGELKIASTHSYGDTGILILFYEVLFWKGEEKTKHHMDLKWVQPDELWQLAIPDANKKILGRLIDCLKRGSMARIAFFSETLPPTGGLLDHFAWDMILSLADQNHDIHVLTTYDETISDPPSHPRVEILRPFRRWGVLELTRVAPLLAALRPDIFHIIQPHGPSLDGLSNAMNFIPGLAPLAGRPPVLTSFFDVDQKLLNRLRPLLGSSDAVTTSNQSQASIIRDFFSKRDPPRLEVVPLGFGMTTGWRASFTEASATLAGDNTFSTRLKNFSSHVQELVCVPGPLDHHTDVVSTFATISRILTERSTIGVIVTGGWGRSSLRQRRAAEEALYQFDIARRVLLTGPLTNEETQQAMRASRCVLLAPLQESRLSFTDILRSAQNEAMPLILSHEQARLDPLNWRDGENALIRSCDPQDLAMTTHLLLTDEEVNHRLKQNVAEFSRSEALDRPGNIVSRLYSQLLM